MHILKNTFQIILFIYLFFTCAGSLLLCRLSLVAASGGYSRCSGLASHCSGFFCCRARALKCLGFRSYGAHAQ